MSALRPGVEGGGRPLPRDPGDDGSGRPDPPASRDDANRWDAFVAAHPAGTIFHSRIWARIVLAAFPGLRDESLVTPVDGRAGVLPLFRWSRARGLLATLHSSFPFVYGGPVPAFEATGGDPASRLLSQLHRPLCSWRLNGNPFVPGDAVPAPAGFTSREDATHLLLLPETEEGYWDGVLTTAQRNDWRRLAKKGVTVEETRAQRDADAVYELYRASFVHWGGEPRFVHPQGFYRALLAHGGDAVRLTVVRHEGRLAGGCFVLRWNGKAHYLAGYFDREARALRPAALLQIESILRAVRDGYRWYDFLPSGGHAPVEEFKEGLGGRRTPFPVWTRRGGLHRLRPEK